MKHSAPRLTAQNYNWIIQELGEWFRASNGTDMKGFILSIANSAKSTNPKFDEERFILTALKKYNEV